MTDTWRRDGVNLLLGNEGFTVFLSDANTPCPFEAGLCVQKLIIEANMWRGHDATDAQPNAWQAETCETCEFQADGYCQQGPPSIRQGNDAIYPVVQWEDGVWTSACAQFERSAAAPAEERADAPEADAD